MITKTLKCDLCGNLFERTGYPSRFKQFKENYCSKRCAVIGAREQYRPTQGIIKRPDGRKMVRDKNHPRANKNNQIPFAHLVMENHIGRYLLENEIVHHINGDPSNDDIENLELMTLSDHVRFHNNLRGRDINGRFYKKLSQMPSVDETERTIHFN